MSARQNNAPAAAVTPAPADVFQWPTRWACAFVFVLTLLAYIPAMQGGFIWDDGGHVTRADLRSLDGLLRIWFEPGATQQYYPLLHSSFWLEHLVWGDSPFGYHLINVLFHATAACLFGVLLRRLMVPGAWLAALLFALHPVCVESVAWITEQKNTLSLVFYLLAALGYLRFSEQRRPADYAWASLLFVAALLCKTVSSSLPAALLVVFWWKKGRLSWRADVLPLIPWFALAAGSGLCTAWMEQTYIGAQGAEFSLGFAARCLVAGRALWFYLWKLFLPFDLIFIYPRWDVDASAFWQYLFPLAALVLTFFLLWYARKQRGPLAVLLLFGGSLFPALGFINVYPFIFSFVADHFQYLASLAVFAAMAFGLVKLSARYRSLGLRSLSIVVLGLLGTLTWLQAGMYRNLFTLYETTISRNPDCWMAHNNLGAALVGDERADEALVHFQAALRLRPDFAEAENNYGDALTRLGRPREAIEHLEHALRLVPHFAVAHCNYGVALLSVGREEEGMRQLEEALRLMPQYPIAHFNLGLAHARCGRMDSAIRHFELAVKQQPDYEEARKALMQARHQVGIDR
jgi:tetratricopeptide (TPR) repeat protein